MVTNPHVRLSPLLVLPVLLAGATVILWWLTGFPRRDPTAQHPHVHLCLHPAEGATAPLLAITGQGLLFLLWATRSSARGTATNSHSESRNRLVAIPS